MLKITKSNSQGYFNLKLKRNVSSEESREIFDFVEKLLLEKNEKSAAIENKFGAYIEPFLGYKLVYDHSIFPKSGLNMVSMVKTLRELTNISIVDCRDILFGTRSFPSLTEIAARKLVEVFRANNVAAQMVQAVKK